VSLMVIEAVYTTPYTTILGHLRNYSIIMLNKMILLIFYKDHFFLQASLFNFGFTEHVYSYIRRVTHSAGTFLTMLSCFIYNV